MLNSDNGADGIFIQSWACSRRRAMAMRSRIWVSRPLARGQARGDRAMESGNQYLATPWARRWMDADEPSRRRAMCPVSTSKVFRVISRPRMIEGTDQSTGETGTVCVPPLASERARRRVCGDRLALQQRWQLPRADHREASLPADRGEVEIPWSFPAVYLPASRATARRRCSKRTMRCSKAKGRWPNELREGVQEADQKRS